MTYLTIFPQYRGHVQNSDFLSFERLNIFPDEEIYNSIRELSSYHIYDLTAFIDNFETVNADPDGYSIKYVYAKDLADILFKEENKPVKAYLENLDPKHPIALYWH